MKKREEKKRETEGDENRGEKKEKKRRVLRGKYREKKNKRAEETNEFYVKIFEHLSTASALFGSLCFVLLCYALFLKKNTVPCFFLILGNQPSSAEKTTNFT